MEELLAESGFTTIEDYLEALDSGIIQPDVQQEIQALIEESNQEALSIIAELLVAAFIIGGVNTISQRRRNTVYYSGLNQRFIAQGTPQTDALMRRRIERERLTTANQTRRLAADYLNGRLTLPQLRRRLGGTILRSHLRMMQVGAGGRQRVTQQHLRALHRRMMGMGPGPLGFGEFQALNRFIGQIRAGELSDAQILARANQYGLNTRPSYEEARGITLSGLGYVAKRFLDPTARHCADCPGYVTDQWLPADQVVDVGVACACRGRCRCLKITARIQDVAGFDVSNFADALGI